MTDVHTRAQRSFNMSRIRATNTKPELLVRRHLHALGYRYTLHNKLLPGKPDMVLPKYNTIIFIHGCFWHGHAHCKYFKMPGTNTQWWADKIARNKANDAKAAKALRKAGWQVIAVWECRLKPAKAATTLQQLVQKLQQL
jgi:DNA mismatch endonuclease, patch repair protein